MKKWEEFEIQCTAHLNRVFGDYAKFSHAGSTNSTVPDILVETKSGKRFYIDVKHSPAQCGQFVLLPNLDNHTFEYSQQNINHINPYTKMIIDHMNQSFDVFKNPGTAGKEINMHNGSDIFAGWIIQTYQDKNVKFFITNDFTILPITEFNDYFQVTAKYRRKRSGSNHIGKTKMSIVTDYVISHNYKISETRADGGNLFVTSPVSLDKQKFSILNTDYIFSFKESEKEYEVRKLSDTCNSNVIFSIKQKKLSGMSNEAFVRYLI